MEMRSVQTLQAEVHGARAQETDAIREKEMVGGERREKGVWRKWHQGCNRIA